MGIPMYVICCFSLVDLIFLSVWLVYILVCGFSLGLACLGLSYWIWVTVSFPMLRKFSTIISLNIFPGPKPFGTPVMQTLGHLLLSQRSLKLSSFHYLFFFILLWQWFPFFQLTYPFFCLIFSYWFSFFHLHYCIHQHLLFFIFYSSLLKICNFSLSILFLSSWITPLIVTRNSFMGGLPMSLSCPMVFIFFLHLKHIPLPSHFVSISSCINSSSVSHAWLFVTPWTAAHQASLSFTISLSLLKLMSSESVMPSNHLILCRPLLLLSSVFPSIRVLFQWVGFSHHVAKVLVLQFSSIFLCKWNIMFLDFGEVALYRGCPLCASSIHPSCHARARDQLVPG